MIKVGQLFEHNDDYFKSKYWIVIAICVLSCRVTFCCEKGILIVRYFSNQKMTLNAEDYIESYAGYKYTLVQNPPKI